MNHEACNQQPFKTWSTRQTIFDPSKKKKNNNLWKKKCEAYNKNLRWYQQTNLGCWFCQLVSCPHPLHSSHSAIVLPSPRPKFQKSIRIKNNSTGQPTRSPFYGLYRGCLRQIENLNLPQQKGWIKWVNLMASTHFTTPIWMKGLCIK